MRERKSRLVLGLFVLVGMFMAVGSIVWLGASKYLSKGTYYVTYFDESVQGLQPDSVVKYRGVDVGHVEKIRVAPDNRLIEIVMKIGMKTDVDQNTIARLKPAGLTGIVFIELDHRPSGDSYVSPRITFTPDYPVIPSYPSQMKEIFSWLDTIVANLKQVDFKGISDHIKSTASSLEGFFKDEKLTKILHNIEAATAGLTRATIKIENIMEEGKPQEVIAEAKAAVTDARALIARAKTEIDSMKLSETTGETRRLIESAGRKIDVLSAEAGAVGESLTRAAQSIEALSERLNESPSDLIFSAPPKKGRQ